MQKSIFIVDDEEPIRKVLNTHLSKEGYAVTQSVGGASVFEDLDSSVYDVVISDLKMPVNDGTSVLEHVRRTNDCAPVIILTGQSDVSTAIEVMKKGAFDYVMKPVAKHDLLTVVKKALEHKELLESNRRLEAENRRYQESLEKMVAERTLELNNKTVELEGAYASLKSMNLRFAKVLAETIEAKDHFTGGHCGRMRALCVELARACGSPEEDMDALEYASLLHDLGKIRVSETVLNKEGPLDDNERRAMREHPDIGSRLLSGIHMDSVAGIIVAHHENYDGTGYPKGLKGEDIPLAARIISVADLYDAMRHTRPYRKGLSLDVTIAELKRVAGTQLDPRLVSIFIEREIYRVLD